MAFMSIRSSTFRRSTFRDILMPTGKLRDRTDEKTTHI